MQEYQYWSIVLAILIPSRFFIFKKFAKKGIIADLIMVPLLIGSEYYFFHTSYVVKLAFYLISIGICVGISYSFFSLFMAIFWEPLKRVWREDR
jgi:hypothetical protein